MNAQNKDVKVIVPATRGTAAAAAALGVTRVHLREVLLGRRKSPGLLARFEEWKNSNDATPVMIRLPLPDEIAAHDNLTEAFLKILSTLGLEVVIVRFDAAPGSEIYKHSNVAHDLEAELRAIEAGQLDSSYFPNGSQWHFYHVDRQKLGVAIKRLKDALVARSLLKISRIFHVEEAQSLMEWYPGSAGAISVPIEPT